MWFVLRVYEIGRDMARHVLLQLDFPASSTVHQNHFPRSFMRRAILASWPFSVGS